MNESPDLNNSYRQKIAAIFSLSRWFWLWLCAISFALEAGLQRDPLWYNEWEEGEGQTLYLDLPTAISIGVDHSKSLANAVDNVKKAAMQLQLCEDDFKWKVNPSGDFGLIGGGTAGMGGAFGGRLSFSKRFALGPSISFSPYFSRDVTKTHNGVDVALFLPIFRGFGEYYTLAPIFAAQYSKRSSYRSAYQAGLEAILRIITGLYEVARYEKLKELEEQAFQRMKHFCEVIAAKEKIALAESLDVYRAEVELANTQDSLNGITDRLQESRDSLKDLLGIPLNRSIVIDIPLEYEPVDLPYNQAVDIALENRMDVEQARDQLKESIRLSRLAKNHMLPQADFVIDFCNSGHDEILTKEFNYKRDNRWGLGFKTSTDWNPSAQQVAYTNSLMQVSSNERALEQVKSNVAVDVKRQLRAVKRSEERIHTQKEQIQRSQGSLKVARLKFDRGWANNFDVIQAEKNLRIAETALLSALIEYRVSLYRVYMALGLLTDKPEFLK